MSFMFKFETPTLMRSRKGGALSMAGQSLPPKAEEEAIEKLDSSSIVNPGPKSGLRQLTNPPTALPPQEDSLSTRG